METRRDRAPPVRKSKSPAVDGWTRAAGRGSGYLCRRMIRPAHSRPQPPRFLTVFTPAENVHFAKDVGLIPQYLAEVAGFSTSLLFQDDGRKLPYAEELAPRVRLERVGIAPGYVLGEGPDPAILAALRRLAWETDILHLFHLTPESMRLALAYKLRNPSGKVYLKLDANVAWLQDWDPFGKGVSKKQRVRAVAARAFMGIVPRLVTAESRETLAVAARLFPALRGRLRLLPNGIDDRWMESHGHGEVDPSDKQDVLLVVGRIGTHQKNHEMLLEALEGIPDPGEWKVVLLGPVEDGFRAAVQAFTERNPAYRDRLVLLGRIDDRGALYEWYARAKVFCLTSRFEGFCLSLVDALHFGCHIVSTPVTSLGDMTDSGMLGEVVEDARALRESLATIFAGRRDPMRDFERVRLQSTKFRWSAIAADLAATLRG